MATLRPEVKIPEDELTPTGSEANEVPEDTWNEWSASYANNDYIHDVDIAGSMGSILYVLSELNSDFINVQQQVSELNEEDINLNDDNLKTEKKNDDKKSK